MNKAIYAGSFDPITYGHIDVLKRALTLFDEVVVLLAINPDKVYRFKKEDRINMVKVALKEEGLDNIEVYFTDGLTIDFAHKIGANKLIRGVRDNSDMTYENKLAQANKSLDPNIETVFIKASDEYKDVSSTLIYEKLKNGEDANRLVPPIVIKTFKEE